MIQLQIDDKVYECPTQWDEISLRKFLKFSQIETQNDSQWRQTALLISALTDIPVEDVYEFDIDSIKTIGEEIKFLHQEIKSNKQTSLMIDGKEYGIINNLNNLTTGEFISLELELRNKERGFLENFINCLPIIIRPIEIVENKETGKTQKVVEKFTTDNLQWRKDLFLDKLTPKDIWWIKDFFSNGGSGYSSNTKDSSAKRVKILKK